MRDVTDIGTLINAGDDEIERFVFAKVQEPEANSIGRAAVDGIAKKFAVSKNTLDSACAAVCRLATARLVCVGRRHHNLDIVECRQPVA